MILTHNFDPVLFSIGFLSVRWYGLMYLLGFLFLYFYLKKSKRFSSDELYDFLFYILLGVLVGGRLGYFVLYNPGIIFSDVLEILKVWHGGMSFHGGLVGVLIAVYFWGKLNGRKFLELMDLLVIPAAVGLFFGRIGNFVNGELWGRVTDGSWGVVFPRVGVSPRHPSQLYEATKNLIIGGVLYSLYVKRIFIRSGALFFSGMTLYGIGRFVVEGLWREPSSGYIWVFTAGQFWTLFVLATGVLGLVWRMRK